MTTTTAYAWAPITKVEDQTDGTVMVYGPAADAGIDRDKQRLNQQWLDQVMPEWMASGGNVREQHDNLRAVGKAVGLTRDLDGTHQLAAHVVDPVAVVKVRNKVLQGFSVRIKDPQLMFGKADAPNGEVVGGSIVEVSLVDRPANPRTYFTMVKSADGGGELTLVTDPGVIEVEGETERVITGEKVLAELATLLPATALAKADAASDISEAQTAIACIGRLIASEATSMAAGQPGEEDEIACLLDAVRALRYFISCEQAEPGQPGDATVADSMSVSGDTYMADAVKTETANPTAGVTVTVPATQVTTTATIPPAAVPAAAATPDLTKVEQSGTADIVKAAITEAMAPVRDELALVKADLAKVLAMPEPGGPVAMRTAQQTVQARAADAITLRAQAAEYLVKADDRNCEDPLLAQGYRERAAELLAKADA